MEDDFTRVQPLSPSDPSPVDDLADGGATAAPLSTDWRQVTACAARRSRRSSGGSAKTSDSSAVRTARASG